MAFLMAGDFPNLQLHVTKISMHSLSSPPSVRWLMLLFAMVCSITRLSAADEELVLPLRVHLGRQMTATVKGEVLDVWVKPKDVTEVLLPEINRIWKQANIRFVIESVADEKTLDVPDRLKLLERISDRKRTDDGKGGDNPFAVIKKLFDPAKVNPSAINIYCMPYIGERFQGVAKLGGNFVLVGVWSDKASGGRKPPRKTLLTEPEPMVIGSLARTMSHELGHSLTLIHPGKEDEPKGRLMGGSKQGYLLTPEEISQAHKSAHAHLKAAKKPDTVE
jgi:hypothetical protein